MTIETQPSSNDERKKIEIKNILVPIDGSEYSLNAAQYATRIARNEKAQLFCIHIVTSRMPYGYATPAASSKESQNYEDIKHRINLWLKTYQAFEKYNIDVKLANPLKTKAIAEARIKTDKLDARTLAHLLRSDLVAECYIANKKTREERSLLRLRTNLVQDRTRVINRTHSLLDKYDTNFGYSKIFGIKGLQ